MLSIGLDIGHHHVRAIALAPPSGRERRDGKRARVVATACVDRLDHEGRTRPLAATLTEVEAVLGRRGRITAHLGDNQTLVRYVPIIPLPPDRRQRLLRMDLMVQHASETNDLAADAWEVPLAGAEIIHGCVIAQPAQVLAGIADLRTARLPAAAVSFIPAAIYNAMPRGTADGEELHLVVDIGVATTGVTLFGDDRLLACRQLSIGGEAFTEALMSTGLDRATAERRKREGDPPPHPVTVAATSATAVSGVALTAVDAAGNPTGLDDESLFADDDAPAPPPPAPPVPVAAAAPAPALELDLDDEPRIDLPPPTPAAAASSTLLPTAVDESLFADALADGDAGGAIPPAGAPAASGSAATSAPLPLPGQATINLGRKALGGELQRAAEALYVQLASSVLWFKSQLKLDKLVVARVHLVGGGAALDGLDAYLQRRFNAPVVRFDPFAALAVSERLRPADPQAWAGVIGLALAQRQLIGTQALLLDIRPESLVRAEFRRRHQVWPYVAAGLVAGAATLAAAVLLRASGAQELSLESYAEWKRKHDDLAKQLTGLEQERAAMSEDLRAIAGRIYAGRDLLYTVRAMKELSLSSRELWVTRLETQGLARDGSDGGGAAPAPTPTPAKAYDTAIDRGTLFLSGRVKFNAAPSDTQLDQFLKTWREAVAAWRPAPEAPTLFLKQRVVEWDPTHRGRPRPGQKVEEGEFPFKIEFTFRPTQLDQITAAHDDSPPREPPPEKVP